MLGDTRVAPLRTITVDPLSDTRWEAWVASQPDGLIYHHPVWLQVLQEAYDCHPAHLACEDSTGQFRGVLPLFYMRGFLTGRRLSSLPRTPIAGPLASDNEALASLVRTAVERVSSEHGVQLQLKMASDALDGLVEGIVSEPFRTTYVLELPERPEALRFGSSRNSARIKWAVNKATRQGVHVRPAESERDLRAWYELYLDTMRWHAVPPRPYRFFEIMWRQLRPHRLLRLLLAEQQEGVQTRLLAGSLFLMFGQTIFYAFNGRRQEDLPLRPNDAIHWQAIQDACADGFRHYDFGEVTGDNVGLAAFKHKWGTRANLLYRYHYPASREAEIRMLESTSHVQPLLKAIWRRMPLLATVIVGDWLHQYF